MIIRSTKITADDLTMSLVTSGITPLGKDPKVFVNLISVRTDRKGRTVIDAQLHAKPGVDAERKRRRVKSNSGAYPNGLQFSPTYREHGWWMLDLFTVDPEAKIGPYLGVEDFHNKTQRQFVRAIARAKKGALV